MLHNGTHTVNHNYPGHLCDPSLSIMNSKITIFKPASAWQPSLFIKFPSSAEFLYFLAFYFLSGLWLQTKILNTLT